MIPSRVFGQTGVQVAALGLGGYHLGFIGRKRDAIALVQEAVDEGVTFLDNAWEYHGGRSEQLMGEALVGRRDQVFLMTKVCTHGQGARAAMRQLEESLRRLRTDHLDLWQIHEVVYDNDPARHFAKDGAVSALDRAKREGKTRFVGFTGHKHPDIHLKMLSYDYPFDACQMPLNCFDATFRSFEMRVLPELRRRGIAPIGMKSLGGQGESVRKRVLNAAEGLRYAMSLPVATTISGIDSRRILHQNLRVARGFTPMRPSEMQALRDRVAAVAGDGRFELYKTSLMHEGPPGRRQHGYPPEEAV